MTGYPFNKTSIKFLLRSQVQWFERVPKGSQFYRPLKFSRVSGLSGHLLLPSRWNTRRWMTGSRPLYQSTAHDKSPESSMLGSIKFELSAMRISPEQNCSVWFSLSFQLERPSCRRDMQRRWELPLHGMKSLMSSLYGWSMKGGEDGR
jgi:hypothetical protein